MLGSLARVVALSALGCVVGIPTIASSQTPQPFPRPPGQPAPAPPPSAPAPTAKPAAPPVEEDVPTEISLGAPVYTGAVYLGAYDAGRGQRFHLFGVGASFAETVTFYRTALKQRGELLFETPGTHMFELGRFRDESMAFPPSVTVKDFTAGGSAGLPNPKGSTPSHFPTVLQFTTQPR